MDDPYLVPRWTRISSVGNLGNRVPHPEVCLSSGINRAWKIVVVVEVVVAVMGSTSSNAAAEEDAKLRGWSSLSVVTPESAPPRWLYTCHLQQINMAGCSQSSFNTTTNKYKKRDMDTDNTKVCSPLQSVLPSSPKRPFLKVSEPS